MMDIFLLIYVTGGMIGGGIAFYCAYHDGESFAKAWLCAIVTVIFGEFGLGCMIALLATGNTPPKGFGREIKEQEARVK